MQALDEGRRRAQQELKTSQRQDADQQQNLEVRSHLLTLREGELGSRLRDRERTIEDLNLRLRELTGLLSKEQATRDAQAHRLSALEAKALTQVRRPKTMVATRTPRRPKGKTKPPLAAPRPESAEEG